MTLLTLLQEQRKFSVSAFGPAPRLLGVLNHLKKELAEVRSAPGDITEWADCFLLCIDGSMRAGGDARHIAAYLSQGFMPEESKCQDGWQFDVITTDLVVLESQIGDWHRWATMGYQVWLAAYHHGHHDLITAATAKLAVNMARSWPDWRDTTEDQAIEHIKE